MLKLNGKKKAAKYRIRKELVSMVDSCQCVAKAIQNCKVK